MMAQLTGWLALASLAAAALVDGRQPELAQTSTPQQLREAFARCDSAKTVFATAKDVGWAPITSALKEHSALRTRVKLPLPTSANRILLYSFGSHHTSVAWSIIATRDASGFWQVDEVAEEGPGLLAIAPRLLRQRTHVLDAETSRTLDQMIESECLHLAPTFQRDGGIVAGGAVQTLEIETPKGRWISSWMGTRTAEQERMVALLAGE